jgi:putative peptidoglycan lipid II flippase
LQLRPTFAFPPGVAARGRRLAAGGVAGLAAQQVALLVALRLAADGQEGSVVVFAVATALFLLPWAVLAVPVATSAYPTLIASGDREYAPAVAGAVRTVLLAMTGAAAVLAVAALPVAQLLVRGAPGVESSDALARATAAFAPGLLGYGLLALLTRALNARDDVRTPAVATVAGWAAVAVADVSLVLALPDVERVVLLGAGNSIGVTVAALLLLRGLDRDALAGCGRSLLAGLAAAGCAVLAGLLVPDAGPALLRAVLTAGAAGLAFLLVARVLDPRGLRELLRA